MDDQKREALLDKINQIKSYMEVSGCTYDTFTKAKDIDFALINWFVSKRNSLKIGSLEDEEVQFYIDNKFNFGIELFLWEDWRVLLKVYLDEKQVSEIGENVKIDNLYALGKWAKRQKREFAKMSEERKEKILETGLQIGYVKKFYEQENTAVNEEFCQPEQEKLDLDVIFEGALKEACELSEIEQLENTILELQEENEELERKNKELEKWLKRRENQIERLKRKSSRDAIENHLNTVIEVMEQTAVANGIQLSEVYVRTAYREGKNCVNVYGEIAFSSGVEILQKSLYIKAVVYDAEGHILIDGKVYVSTSFSGFDVFDIGWTGGTTESWNSVSKIKLFVVKC